MQQALDSLGQSARALCSMLARTKRLPRQLYRFRGCLNGPRLEKRSATTTTIPANLEDASLIPFFDDPNEQRIASAASTGLFAYKDLTKPSSLTRLAEGTRRRAQALTERILQARNSRGEVLLALKNLDKLSNLLCGVIDLSEVIRSSHPDSRWIESADEAYNILCDFMNELNTHVGLYEARTLTHVLWKEQLTYSLLQVLKRVFSDPSILDSLSHEAYYTALVFWRDFEKSAIHLPAEHRQKFVSLSSEINYLGRKFLNQMSSARPPAIINRSELDGLKDLGMGARLSWQAHYTNKPLAVYPGSLQAQMIMRSAPNESPRMKLYVASNSSTPEQVYTLERLMRARSELARLCGKESYAHLTLNDKMAKSPGMYIRVFIIMEELIY